MPNSKNNNLVNFQWLLQPSGASDPTPISVDFINGQQHIPIDVPEEMGQAWIDKLAISDVIDLSSTVHDLRRSTQGGFLPQMNIDADVGVDHFSFTAWTHGQGMFHEYWDGRSSRPLEVKSGPGELIFRCASWWDMMMFAKAGTLSKLHALVLPVDELATLVGEDSVGSITEVLGLRRGGTPTVVRPIPRHLLSPLTRMATNPYSGLVAKLYHQARVLDFLVGVVHHYTTEMDSRADGTGRYRERVRDLHDYLTTLEGAIPSLHSLAQDFGLSAKRLNEVFAAEYGQSMFAYITARRLEAAHQAMLESDEPMKLVAQKLGYSHVNHFITAFKRKYGYTPGSLRRRRGGQQT
jgi:AraC-like DNA-binding protein